jgi:hypothetical protein
VSARRKTPTADDHKRTAIFDSGEHGPRDAPPDEFPADVDPTVIDGPLASSLNHAPDPTTGPTTILDRPASKAAPTVLGKSVPSAVQAAAKKQQAAPMQAISMKDSSARIQAISMKTPGTQQAPAREPNPPTPILARPKLRAIAEVTPANQQKLGHMAAPYDPEEARARRLREYVIWGCVAVMLASAIALVVWFTAR